MLHAKERCIGLCGLRDPDVDGGQQAALSPRRQLCGPAVQFPGRAGEDRSSFIVNGRVALADVAINDGSTLLTFALWTRNLFNETHIYRRSAANSSPVASFTNGVPNGSFSYTGILGDYGNFNPPRTWGAEISFKMGAPRRVEPYVAPPAPPPPPATVTCRVGRRSRRSGTVRRRRLRHRRLRPLQLRSEAVSRQNILQVWRPGRRGKRPIRHSAGRAGPRSGAAFIFSGQ